MGNVDPSEPAACESCGGAETRLVPVRRIYLVNDGEAGQHHVMPEIERWCFPCRTHYPHELVGFDGDEPGP